LNAASPFCFLPLTTAFLPVFGFVDLAAVFAFLPSSPDVFLSDLGVVVAIFFFSSFF
tara:strand:- start:214 stop:384 length:171 start_codon:yes stop_codon:yes gene_type:complete